VLVLGASGHFGGRICRALAREPEIELYLAARRREPLEGLAQALGLGAERVVPTNLDEHALRQALSAHGIGTVIHTVGPFQGQPYQVAGAAIATGAHYVDLADGREFVAGFAAALDRAAHVFGVLAVSGASTLPALSSAVIDHYLSQFDTLEHVEIVIAPAQRTSRGPATIDAVLSYCGRPFSWREDGRWRTTHGWQSLRRVRLPELGVRLAAACDVPDLELLPERYATVRTLQFRAALELDVQHVGLWFLAGARRAWPGLPIRALAPAMAAIGRALDRFGGVRGGMSIRMRGTHGGRTIERTWYLVAEDNQGPEIPCLAAEMLAIKLARGEIAQRGALPCIGLLTLPEFERAFAAWPYRWGLVDDNGVKLA
jgi:saccharopine dehydrogenase-like NADP-dependent oxidoreductase